MFSVTFYEIAYIERFIKIYGKTKVAANHIVPVIFQIDSENKNRNLAMY